MIDQVSIQEAEDHERVLLEDMIRRRGITVLGAGIGNFLNRRFKDYGLFNTSPWT